MTLKNLAGMTLVGAVLICGSAANAADNQADWTTTLNVKMALLDKLGTDSLHVDVDSTAGALLLKGTVNKRETRELAETVAKTVTGVKTVKNDIALASSVADPNKAGVGVGEAEAELKDALLETKVRMALVGKMESNGFKIGTQVASGVVTLEFDHDFTAAHRKEANTVVKGVEGVTKVVTMEKKA